MDFQLKLTEAELNLVLEALSVRPFREVVGLINKLSEQARQQVQPQVQSKAD